MFERFGFEAGHIFSPSEVVNFNDLQGMKCVSVSDTASVGYSIQSTENPFFDGQQFQARRAQGREMEIVFEYDYTIPPEEADRNLFSQIPFGLSQNSFNNQTLPENYGFRLFKVKNGVKKVILCAIKSIEHQVYKEQPQLQIVLSTEPYWRGSNDTVTLTRDPSKDYYPNMQAFTIETKGDIAADYVLMMKFTPKEGVSFPVSSLFKLYTIAYEVLGDNGNFDTEFIPLEISNSSDYVFVRVGFGERQFIFEKNNRASGTLVSLYDYQLKPFPKLYPNTRTIFFDSEFWQDYCDLTVEIGYTPLYIR